MENNGGALTVYEIGYLVLPSISEDALSLVVENIKAAIVKEGGKEIDGEAPFKQDLAYTMTKTIGASRYVVNDAYIGWVKFEAEPANVLKIKALVEKMDEVLRFLLIKAPRETTFTFAEARKALMEEENQAGEDDAAGEPVPTEDAAVAPTQEE